VGYSKSIKTLESRLGWLDKLQKGEADKWILTEGSDPELFAYQVREALYIASLYPGAYPELAQAQKYFRIERVDDHTVQAVPRPEPVAIAGRGEPGVSTQGLVHGEKSPPNLMGQQTADSVIQAWHNMQPSNTPMHFPQAKLDVEQLERLYQWGMSRTPQWLLFVGLNGQLTLRMRVADEFGFWEPGDEA
jgi:hypothetical protein